MKQRKPLKNQKQNKSKVLNLLIKISSGIVAGALVVTFGIWFVNLQEQDLKVNQIAKNFRCICEMNCSMILSTCSCTKPGGATERKASIRKALKQGLNEAEIITTHNQKYGGLIN